MPGAVPEGRRSIWEMGDVRVLDGGSDGQAGTGPTRPTCARESSFRSAGRRSGSLSRNSREENPPLPRLVVVTQRRSRGTQWVTATRYQRQDIDLNRKGAARAPLSLAFLSTVLGWDGIWTPRQDGRRRMAGTLGRHGRLLGHTAACVSWNRLRSRRERLAPTAPRLRGRPATLDRHIGARCSRRGKSTPRGARRDLDSIPATEVIGNRCRNMVADFAELVYLPTNGFPHPEELFEKAACLVEFEHAAEPGRPPARSRTRSPDQRL